MKRALYLFLSVLMCLGCSVPVLATSDDAITRVVVSDEAKSVEKDGVIFTREDVPSSIAACDASFRNKPQDANISTLEVQNTKSTYWDVKGWSEPAELPEGALAEIPFGSSAHVKDGEVLLTWHYTRTYLSDLFKYGDSGRRWRSCRGRRNCLRPGYLGPICPSCILRHRRLIYNGRAGVITHLPFIWE